MWQSASVLLTLLVVLAFVIPHENAQSFAQEHSEETSAEAGSTASVPEHHHRKEVSRKRQPHAKSQESQIVEESFSRIYANHIWGNMGGGSGKASYLAAARHFRRRDYVTSSACSLCNSALRGITLTLLCWA